MYVLNVRCTFVSMEWIGLLIIVFLCALPHILIATDGPGRWVNGQRQTNAQMKQRAQQVKVPVPEPQVQNKRPAEPVTVKPLVVTMHPTDNVPGVDDWYIGEWGIGAPSPAEQLIINELQKYNVKWFREVSFRGLVLPSGGSARFDFWFPDRNTIIEYDSKKWHVDPARVENDEIKSAFCRTHNIKLIRLNSRHYYKMEQTIYDIVKEMATLSVSYDEFMNG